MGRKKVQLSYISNHCKRKNTFKKRKLCVAKKLDELTTLCGIEGCTVIYSEFDPEPFVWPSVDEARRLIMKYWSFSKVDQVKRNVNQETFTEQWVEKMKEKLKKQQRDNRRIEMTYIMFQSMIYPQIAMSNLNVENLEELTKVTSQKLMDVDKLMEIRCRDSSFDPLPQFEVDNGNGVGPNFPPNYLPYMDPNMGMPDSTNLPPFP